MTEMLKDVYEMLKIDRKNSAWSAKNTMEFRFAELKSEINELNEALKNQDVENLKEEIGDSIGDLLFLIVIAEEYGYFSLKEVIETYFEKFKRRKPWIFSGEKLTIEEEMKRWRETKILEKNKK
ncbi:MAG: hypothetical protein HOI47_07665 [Candidatus Scalindua sp.]|jgi:NTP pyrophosphatase (non-canonical NTP hydrolase)|nr:hypothetical protein [archaeon]MBT6226515.1 hypothetical protein [Candidatus Scalindua sp.]MBT3720005.1 hypothetical protein [archaeon]MBT4273189.1 hypothetical protein [archaeon]MBT4460294.1 hypothetical protein [archaeon]